MVKLDNIQIESFISFFKIYKNLEFSLKTINYLSSLTFLENIFTLLNFNQYDFVNLKINQKDFFYGFCYILYKQDKVLFSTLLEKFFAHFHSSLNNNSNIHIDLTSITKELAVTRKINLKESFGEEEKQSYFNIKIDDNVSIDLKGKSIKTLRKKAYRKLFYLLLDFDENAMLRNKQTIAYEHLEELTTI